MCIKKNLVKLLEENGTPHRLYHTLYKINYKTFISIVFQTNMTEQENKQNEPEAQMSPETTYQKRYRIFYPAHIRKCNRATVQESDAWYNMSGCYPRGRMVVVNNQAFHSATGLPPRKKSGSDVESLVNTFLRLVYFESQKVVDYFLNFPF